MSLEYEDLARLAQRYVADRPLLVLGSGASIPHGLPSMSKLATELLRRIRPRDDQTEKKQWKSFRDTLSTTKDLERTLHEVILTESLFEQVVRHTWECLSPPDATVHSRLLANPNLLPLTTLLRHLLRTASAKASIITTNYDRLPEYAASAAGASYFTGFGPGFFSRFQTTAVPNQDFVYFPGNQGHVSIWKVHGSLDWFETSEQEPLAIQGAQSVPTDLKPLIVTPGVSKYRRAHQDPFRTVLTRADATIEGASGFLCIGYGFNDDHVQPKLLHRHRKTRVPLTLLTKKLTSTAKTLLLGQPADRYLLLEESTKGTRVYTPACPDGQILKNQSLWRLPDFLEMITGER